MPPRQVTAEQHREEGLAIIQCLARTLPKNGIAPCIPRLVGGAVLECYTVKKQNQQPLGEQLLDDVIGRSQQVRASQMRATFVTERSSAVRTLLAPLGGYLGFQKAQSVAAIRAGTAQFDEDVCVRWARREAGCVAWHGVLPAAAPASPAASGVMGRCCSVLSPRLHACPG